MDPVVLRPRVRSRAGLPRLGAALPVLLSLAWAPLPAAAVSIGFEPQTAPVLHPRDYAGARAWASRRASSSPAAPRNSRCTRW